MQPDEDDEALIARLRAGDEAAFAVLVRRHHGPLMRIARSFVSTREAAEDIVQDTWVGVLQGLPKFEGRSAFRTWLFHIALNRARTWSQRNRRTVPVQDVASTVDPARFDANGYWSAPAPDWGDEIDERLYADSLAPQLRRALSNLPPRQREVVTARDVAGLSSSEVCELLGISEANQRVLLHRARTTLRNLLEREISEIDHDERAVKRRSLS